MKHFKVNFAGKCDMKLVQDVLKTLQNKHNVFYDEDIK